MKEPEDMTFNELKDFYEENSKIIKQLEELIETRNEEYDNLKDELEDLEEELKAYDNLVGIGNRPTLLDQLKFDILTKAYHIYSLDELEKRLNLDYCTY